MENQGHDADPVPAEPEFRFPPGYRFVPTDEELITQYLAKKIKGEPIPVTKMHDVTLYDHSPEYLTAKYAKLGEKDWYFFTPRDRKYPNGFRPKRSVGPVGSEDQPVESVGFWKATGSDKDIHSSTGVVIGKTRSLVFYNEKPKPIPIEGDKALVSNNGKPKPEEEYKALVIPNGKPKPKPKPKPKEGDKPKPKEGDEALVIDNGKPKTKPKEGDKTNWTMHEFRLNAPSISPSSNGNMKLDDCVLCRISNKGKTQNPVAHPSVALIDNGNGNVIVGSSENSDHAAGADEYHGNRIMPLPPAPLVENDGTVMGGNQELVQGDSNHRFQVVNENNVIVMGGGNQEPAWTDSGIPQFPYMYGDDGTQPIMAPSTLAENYQIPMSSGQFSGHWNATDLASNSLMEPLADQNNGGSQELAENYRIAMIRNQEHAGIDSNGQYSGFVCPWNMTQTLPEINGDLASSSTMAQLADQNHGPWNATQTLAEVNGELNQELARCYSSCRFSSVNDDNGLWNATQTHAEINGDRASSSSMAPLGGNQQVVGIDGSHLFSSVGEYHGNSSMAPSLGIGSQQYLQNTTVPCNEEFYWGQDDNHSFLGEPSNMDPQLSLPSYPSSTVMPFDSTAPLHPFGNSFEEDISNYIADFQYSKSPE